MKGGVSMSEKHYIFSVADSSDEHNLLVEYGIESINDLCIAFEKDWRSGSLLYRIFSPYLDVYG